MLTPIIKGALIEWVATFQRNSKIVDMKHSVVAVAVNGLIALPPIEAYRIFAELKSRC